MVKEAKKNQNNTNPNLILLIIRMALTVTLQKGRSIQPCIDMCTQSPRVRSESATWAWTGKENFFSLGQNAP